MSSLPARATLADPVKVSGFSALHSLDGCFAEFLRRIIPTGPAYLAAKQAASAVARDLRAELYRNSSLDVATTDHIVAGSVGKRTALAPIRVVDLLYALPPKLSITKAGDGLKTAWAVLKSKYAQASIAEDHTGVLVPGESMTVKVLPCLPRDGAFLVPGPATLDRASGWSITNPIAEAATLRLMDSMYGSRPRLLMAALRAWRAHNAVAISSFALELLAQDFYSSAPRPFELPAALADFWAWAKKRTPATLKPPGASTAVVIDAAWHGKAKAAYWRASLAVHHMSAGKTVDAALEWRQALGPLFPLPGERPEALPLFPEKGGKRSAA
jgi:hypothetical protein